jgi:hypothetical protein
MRGVRSLHRIARPRPTFSTFPLRCMSRSASATRRTKSVRVVVLRIESLVAHRLSGDLEAGHRAADPQPVKKMRCVNSPCMK